MFEKRTYSSDIDKLNGLKSDLDGLMALNGYIDYSKILMLYVYVALKMQNKEGIRYDSRGYLDIPNSAIMEISDSPEKFCEYVNDNFNDTYMWEKIKGRTLRDYWTKYNVEYSLEIVLSKEEIVKLFLYYYPYPKYDRDSLKAKFLIDTNAEKYIKRWTVPALGEKINEVWGYKYSDNTISSAIKRNEDFKFNFDYLKKKGSIRKITVVWKFSKIRRKKPKKELSDYLPIYKFNLTIYGYGYKGNSVELILSEADCFLMNKWIGIIEDEIKMALRNDIKIEKIFIKRMCKQSEYVFQYLKRKNMFEQLEICD